VGFQLSLAVSWRPADQTLSKVDFLEAGSKTKKKISIVCNTS